MITFNVPFQSTTLDVLYDKDHDLVCIPDFNMCGYFSSDAEFIGILFQWMDERQAEGLTSSIRKRLERKVNDIS